MKVWVGRSPWRLLAYSIVGAAMLLMAIDMTFSNRFYPLPDADETVTTLEDGTEATVRTLNRDGQAQRRRDITFGVGLGFGGLAILLWSVREVVARRPLLVADETGLMVHLGTRRDPPLRLEWDEISEVRTGVREDDAGVTSVLSLRLTDPERVPVKPRSAIAEPPWLHLVSEEWDVAARQVAPVVEAYITGLRGAGRYE